MNWPAGTSPCFIGCPKVKGTWPAAADVTPSVVDSGPTVPLLGVALPAGTGGAAPAALDATTLTDWATPFGRPGMMSGEAGPEMLAPAGLAVAVKVTGRPPVAPGVNSTSMAPESATKPVMVGGDGAVAGTTGAEGADSALLPLALVA